MTSPVPRAWRTGMPGRPPVACPPERMPLLRGGRPLKRWRWIGCFADDVMLSAAVARVGPAPLSWWAVWDRRTRTLAEHTVRRASAVRFTPDGGVHVDDGPVTIDLRIEPDAGVETISAHGDQYIWTRKHGGVPMRGAVTVAERRHEIDAFGIVDESAGYHARHTAWSWSAGVGVAASGARVAWNLVSGVHDGDDASERTVWVDGRPHHVAPVRFDADLSAVRFAGGAVLSFAEETRRGHVDRLLVVSSNYVQPFGRFTGALPAAGPLREGVGVMERHDVRW